MAGMRRTQAAVVDTSSRARRAPIWALGALAFGLAATPARADITLVSKGDTSVGPSAAGGVVDPAPYALGALTSDDGRFTVFTSTAANLVMGSSDGNAGSDVFLYDRSSGTTTIVSHAVGAPLQTGNGVSAGGVISGDGRFVAFSSTSSDIAPGDVNGTSDVFLFDRTTGSNTIVSHVPGSPSSPTTGVSDSPSLSGDGRFVAFESTATNLVGGQVDSVGSSDIFLYDRVTGLVILASHTVNFPYVNTANNPSANPRISRDGSTIVFDSEATNLATSQTEFNSGSDVFFYDCTNKTVTLVSHSASGTQKTANGPTSMVNGGISGNGLFIVFRSTATDLVASQNDVNSGGYDIFLFDRTAGGTVTLVSHAFGSSTMTGNFASDTAAISDDGNWVAFGSAANNLVSGSTPQAGIYVYDRTNLGGLGVGANTLVSHGNGVPTSANAPSAYPAINGDGSVVVFTSSATDLAPGQVDSAATADVFVWARGGPLGTIALVSHVPTFPATAANADSHYPTISRDGAVIAYSSLASNITAPAGTNGIEDVFVYDRGLTTNVLVTTRLGGISEAAGGTISGDWPQTMSSDGRYVVFVSPSGTVVPGQVDTNNGGDIFLYDRQSDSVKLASHVPGNPTKAANDRSSGAVISADGAWVAFLSRATDLVSPITDTNLGDDVFLYDVAGQTVSLASHLPLPGGASTTGNGACGHVSISSSVANGVVVAFTSASQNLVAGQNDINGPGDDVFIYSRATNSVALVSHVPPNTSTQTGNNISLEPRVSAGGNLVVFGSMATDLGAGTDGNLAEDVFLYRVGSGAVSLLSHAFGNSNAATGASSSPSASDNEAKVVYLSTATNIVLSQSDGNSATDVFISDTTATPTNALVSRSTLGPTTTGNAASFQARVSANGTYVVYTTAATDIVAGDGNNVTDVIINNRTFNTNSLISHVAGVPGNVANGASSSPVISSNEGFIAFASAATNMITGPSDTNGQEDVFLYAMSGGAISLVSHVPGNLNGAGNASSGFPVIGTDSSFISFQSNASDLVDGDLDGAADVFLASQTCSPTAPSGLSATANGNNRIDLSWTITGPDTYEVYRRTATGTFALIGSTSFNSFSDTTADGGITYFYMVTNGCGATNTVSAAAPGACSQPPGFGGAAAAWQTAAATCTVQVSWAAGTSPCGGTVSYSVYRDTTPAIVPSASTRLATYLSPTSYLDSASLSAGTTYYYVVRATSSANNEEDQNTVVQAATPTGCTTSAPPPVQFFDVRSGNNDNTLEWVNPVAGYQTTVLRYRTDTYPTSVTDGNPVPPTGFFAGTPGLKDRATHTGLTNGTTYYYAAFVEDSVATPSSGKTSLGRPDTMALNAKWGYATAAAALATPGVIPNRGYYVVSNDRVLHSNDRGTAGGTWPTPWLSPAGMNGPSQGRPMVVALPTTIVMGATRIAVAGSQDGRVYAFNADSGAFLWVSAVLGAAVQASPSGLFVDFGGAANLVLVGTREPTGDSKFYALRLADGSEAWHFDNGGGTNGIGIITGQAQVQYPNRVYFTSRKKGGGSQNTVWCLQFDAITNNTTNPPVKLWGQNYNDTDAGPVLRNNVLYVGNTAGEVRALNPASGGMLWTGPYATGDGPVKGYIWVQQIAAGNTRLFFSTNGKVHAIRDNGIGTAATAFWSSPVAVTNVSPPYFLNGRVYVGGDNSRVYSIDGMLATPPAATTVVLGDPAQSKVVGSPTIDTINQVLVVGTDQGLVYSVQLPIP
jgi:hypothetical protein